MGKYLLNDNRYNNSREKIKHKKIVSTDLAGGGARFFLNGAI